VLEVKGTKLLAPDVVIEEDILGIRRKLIARYGRTSNPNGLQDTLPTTAE
jgi:hypothetical protein